MDYPRARSELLPRKEGRWTNRNFAIMTFKAKRFVLQVIAATILLTDTVRAAESASNIAIRNESEQTVRDVIVVTDARNTFRLLAPKQEAALASSFATVAKLEWTDHTGVRHSASPQLPGKSRCGDDLYLGSVIRIRNTGASSAAICWRAWESYEDPQ